MIELEAEILRGSCTPVFFVGETIECEIRFRHVPKKETNSSKFSKNNNNKKASLNNSTSEDFSLAYPQITTQISHSNSELVDSNSISNNDFESDINESMFSILSAVSSNSSKSTSMNSLAITPTFPIQQQIYNQNKKQSKSNLIFTFNNNDSSSIDLSDLTIAWSCAQIDCHCFIDESKVNLPKDPLRYNLNNTNTINNNTNPNNNEKQIDLATTSFQPNKDRVGISVFSSKPKILFCNLPLLPNQTKSFLFREKLPYDLAPTFRGQFAKYTYKLTIGVQKLNRSTQLLRLPFRVFSLLDFEKYIPRNDLFIYEYNNTVYNPNTTNNNNNTSNASLNNTSSTNLGNGANNLNNKKRNSTLTSIDKMSQHSESFDFTQNISALDNPFKIEEKSDYENLEYALQVIEDITASTATSHYNVTSPDGKIVKITLNKTNYKVGDKIVAFLDFSDAQISCVEYKVTLQSEEIIAEECRKKLNQQPSSIHSHAELKEFCLYLKKTDFTMQIPVNLTPTFVSDIISLRWRLHFDFALSKTNIQKIHRSNDAAMSVSWHPPNYLSVEVISWDLPVFLHPFDPFIASDLIYSNNKSNDINKLTIN